MTNLNGFRKWTANAKKEKFNDFTILCNCEWNIIFSLLHLISRRGEKSQVLFSSISLQNPYNRCPFSSAIVALARCFPPNIHTTKWYETRLSSHCLSVIPAKLLSGHVVHSCVAAALRHLLLAPTLPCKSVNRVSIRKVALSPSLAHLQCFIWCRNVSTQLGSLSFHPSIEWLWRELIPSPPYHSCRQRHGEWLAPVLAGRPETGLSLLYPPGPGPVSSLWGILCIHSTWWNLLRKVLKPSAKHREAGVCSWGLWRILQPWNMLPQSTEIRSNCAESEKEKVTSLFQKLVLILMSVSKSS